MFPLCIAMAKLKKNFLAVDKLCHYEFSWSQYPHLSHLCAKEYLVQPFAMSTVIQGEFVEI